MKKLNFLIVLTILMISELALCEPVKITAENMFGNPAPGTQLIIRCLGLSQMSGVTNKLGQFMMNVPADSKCKVWGKSEQGTGSLEFTVPAGGCSQRLDLDVN